MKRFFQHLNDPASANILAHFRIGVGVFALLQTLVLLPDWVALYGPDGIIPWQIAEHLSTTYTPSVGHAARLLSHFQISPQVSLYIVTIVYLASLLGLVVGYKTRLMGVVAYLMHLMLNTTGHFIAYGVETFMHIALFYCMVLPVGASLSVDAKQSSTIISPVVTTLGVRVVQIHLCIMYMACGIEKALGPQWWSGEAIWVAMQQDQFHRVNIDWMARLPLVPKILCIGTLLVETLYPLGMYWKKTRHYWLMAIVGMHLFIGIFLGLYLFAALMIVLNVTVFGHRLFSVKIRNRVRQLLSLPTFKRNSHLSKIA